MNSKYKTVLMFVLLTLVSACSEKVGSKEWCDSLEEAPREQWSDNQALIYARDCLIQEREQE